MRSMRDVKQISMLPYWLSTSFAVPSLRSPGLIQLNGNGPDHIRPNDLSSKILFLLIPTLTNLMFYLLYKIGLTNFSSLIHYAHWPELIYLLLADPQVFFLILGQFTFSFLKTFILSKFEKLCYVFPYYFKIPIKALLDPFPFLITFIYTAMLFNINLGRILDIFSYFLSVMSKPTFSTSPSVLPFEPSNRLLTLNVTIQQINRVSRKGCSVFSFSPPLAFLGYTESVETLQCEMPCLLAN